MRHTTRTVRALAGLTLLGAAACSGPSGDPAGPGAPLEPAAWKPTRAVLQRLTRAQYAGAVHDLFGDDVVVAAGSLPPDAPTEGSVAVGTAENDVSVRGVEQYERAALAIAAQALDEERRTRIVTCAPAAAVDADCAGEVLGTVARLAYRRALDPGELDVLVTLVGEAGTALGEFHAGLQYGVAAILQSPDFLYRPAIGAPTEADPAISELGEFELASRLAFFLWDAMPDEELLDLAERGELRDQLEAQVDRLLESDRARRGLRAFVREWLDPQHAIEGHDPLVFFDASPELVPAAQESTFLTIERMAFDVDGDFRDLFTSRETFVDARLAALYSVPAPSAEGFELVTLPEGGVRRGLLGHASFLATQSHASGTSPTLRGAFVRESILCQEIPPPPPDVGVIPEPSPELRTLRERLERHRSDASCASCHALLDPIGLAFENFDGVGRFRTRDNGVAIDPSGVLDGSPFRDAAELATQVRRHPSLAPCFVERMMRYATAQEVGAEQAGAHNQLTRSFAAHGFRIRELMRELARHPYFRQVETVEAPSEEGEGT